MTPTRTKIGPDVHAVRAMFAGLGLPVCDDDEAIVQARDAQRDARNRQLNSTKGSVAVAAQGWFEAVDALLKRRPELLEALYGEFAALADAVLVVAGASGKRRLRGRVRGELAGLAQRWMGAREDLATLWVERWLVDRGATKWAGAPGEPSARSSSGAELSAAAGGERTRTARRSTGGTAGAASGPVRDTRKRLALALGSALALVVAIAGLYHSVGLGADTGLASASAMTADATDADVDATGGEPDAATRLVGGDAATSGDPADELTATGDDTGGTPSEARDDLVTSVEAPDLCFGGHRVELVVSTTDRVREEVVISRLDGLKLGEVRRAPEGLVVELLVSRLPPDAREGQARWAFRLLDLDGHPSTPVTGSCRVLPGGW